MVENNIQNQMGKKIKNLKIPKNVMLVAVSKTKPISMIKEAYNAGQRIFGESYCNEGINKIHELKDLSDIKWHFIGHLQSNKTTLAAKNYDMIESVDRKKIARRLNKTCKEIGKILPILIQINIGNEKQKGGVSIKNLEDLIDFIIDLSNLKLKGFMCIPPFDKDPKQYFEQMKCIFDDNKEKYKLTDLSMGMSADYKSAIESGATMVRIGSKLFGIRK